MSFDFHSDQSVPFRLTNANFRRFEPIIKAAVLSHPTPVEVDWTMSDLRYSTFVGRLRDAITCLKNNPEWGAEWMSPDYLLKLKTLVVKNSTVPSKIIIGDLSAVKEVKPINAEVSQLVQKFTAGLQQPSQQVQAYAVAAMQPPELRLSTSLDPVIFEQAVKAFAVLASVCEGIGKLHIIKENLDADGSESLKQTIEMYCDGYDVAVQDHADRFVIF